MKGFSAKNKIIVVLIIWLTVSAAMFLFFFNLLDNQNQATLDSMAQERKDLVVLQAQDASYKKAQADLQELAGKPLQPQDFFTSDTSLVYEIQTLENLAAKYNLKMQIGGVAGTVNSLMSAGTVTPIVTVPYSISLNGDFFQVVNFIESLEHLSFITNPTNISIEASDNGNVSASMTANFYLRK
jgi:Tfp pilus assembly protein PilO